MGRPRSDFHAVWLNGFWLASRQTHQITPYSVARFVPVDHNAVSVGQKPCRTILHMLQTLGGYRARLSCADGQKRYTLRSAGKDRDCPFSIRRQATSAAFTQTIR